MGQRKVFVTLELFTDADNLVLGDQAHWQKFIVGSNPSFAHGGGREPLVRLMGVELEDKSLGRIEAEVDAPASEPKGQPSVHECCGKPKNRPHATGCEKRKAKTVAELRA